MKNKTKFATMALLGAAVATVSATEAEAKKGEHEKCYGVAKAGKNDCGSKGHSCAGKTHECATKPHSCAGQATHDADRAEWVYVPKGLCDKLYGGSLESGS